VAKGVFTTKVQPEYDDLPELRYHFPKTYLRQAEKTVGDWIIYYEPRREGEDDAGRAGRQAYFATARVKEIIPDSTRSDHFYALVADYLDFEKPVPFRQGNTILESALQKRDGSVNRDAFGRSVRLIREDEYELIARLGFIVDGGASFSVRESATIDRPIVETIVSRPFRDAAFSRSVKSSYRLTCAVTGFKLVNGGGRPEVESAHIRPVGSGHNGTDSVRNGVALSRTVHWMFDRGLISVADDYTILISGVRVPEQVRALINSTGRLLLPADPQHHPHRQFLEYHRERIFKSDRYETGT
jgi:putative restriction endonuclease